MPPTLANDKTGTKLAAYTQALPPKANTSETTAVRMKDGKRMKIGRKLKRALDLMVWEGLPWNDAAPKADFDIASMRKALERPHVRKYLQEQKQVFRTSVSARNIHVLASIRDSGENQMARLGAVKLLEQVDEHEAARTASRAPGVVIQIVQAGAVNVSAHTQPVEPVSPVIDHDDR